MGIWLIAFSHWLMALKKNLGYCRHLSSLRCHQCRNGVIVIKEVRSSLVVSISYIIICIQIYTMSIFCTYNILIYYICTYYVYIYNNIYTYIHYICMTLCFFTFLKWYSALHRDRWSQRQMRRHGCFYWMGRWCQWITQKVPFRPFRLLR